MSYKKSQITIFLILAIIIVFILVLSFNLDKVVINSNQPFNINQIESNFKSHVESCIESSAIEALFLVGRQGGVIYDYQVNGALTYLGPNLFSYGEFILPVKDEFGVFNVSYGIVRSINELEPPFYPYGFEKLIENPKLINSDYKNIFGNYPEPGPLNPLCNPTGPNAKDTPGIIYFCTSYGSKNLKNSIQDYLNLYITNKTLECIDYSIFSNVENFELDENLVKTDVKFTNEELIVDVFFPVRLKLDENTFIKVDDFTVNIQNRLKLIHELAEKLIEHDVNNVFFDIVRHAERLNDCRKWKGTNSYCLKDGISVSRIINPCLKNENKNCPKRGNYDNVLVIEDKKVTLQGAPYTFYLAIQNRRPALDLIYNDSKTYEGFDIVGVVGERIVIDPKGYDPDSDYHGYDGIMKSRYSYNMWKEDYNDIYKKWYCEYKRDDIYVNLDSCLNDLFDEAVSRINERPKNFTQSIEFVETKRKAGYTPTKKDIGAHNLKVQVCDEENLCDFQILKILICCKFEDGECILVCED